MATYIVIDLEWDKMKIDIYCYLIADFMTKHLLKCSLSGPLPNLSFLL